MLTIKNWEQRFWRRLLVSFFVNFEQIWTVFIDGVEQVIAGWKITYILPQPQEITCCDYDSSLQISCWTGNTLSYRVWVSNFQKVTIQKVAWPWNITKKTQNVWCSRRKPSLVSLIFFTLEGVKGREIPFFVQKLSFAYCS